MGQKQKAVVTGGAGFIGSHIVDELIERGFDVAVIDNLIEGEKKHVNKKAILHDVDIRNIEAIKPVIKSAQYVFHAAALPRVQYSIENPNETNDVNVNGTLNVLIASHEGGVEKVVYSTSSAVYGDQPASTQDGGKTPLAEDMPVHPLSPYGLQKYVGELQCKLWSKVYGLPTVSLRYFNVYGSRQNTEGAYALVIGKFLKQRGEGKPMTITGDGEQTRDFIHVYDVVRANMLAAESTNISNGEVFNIGAGNNFSVNRIAELIGGETTYIPTRLEPKHTLADNTRARELLGWEPEITIEEGIAKLKKLLHLA